MKPRIFIAMHYMEIGGAESSLIGLLEALDPNRVDIDLFIYSHQGLYMQAIPKYVNILPEIGAYSMIEKPIIDVLKKGYFSVFLARLIALLRHKMFHKRHIAIGEDNIIFSYIGEEISKVLPDLYKHGEYDLAISYLTPHNYVLDHVQSKKKIAWIHTDYSKISFNTSLELPIWNGYDKIVSISPDVTKGFLSKFPSLKDKILEMENILPKAYILRRTEESLELIGESLEYGKEGILTLCSVGRISYPKNYDNIPYMAKELQDLFKAQSSKFKDFEWYIVGPGNHDDIDKLSKELGVKENVIFLGPSDNPYPYIKNCDIYVHPSRYEGKSVVVREAQILYKPVIITNYPTAHSQIHNGVDGMICELDNKKIAEAIFCLANNDNKQGDIINYLRQHDISGQIEVDKIYKLID